MRVAAPKVRTEMLGGPPWLRVCLPQVVTAVLDGPPQERDGLGFTDEGTMPRYST